MINKWLKEVKRVNTHYSKFSVINLTENDMKEELKELKKFLANRILIHLDYPERLRRIYRDKPNDKLRKHVSDLILPNKNVSFNPEQSFLGEILTAEILEKIRKAILPIYKLRYKELKDRAMRGKADVLACRIFAGKPVLIFAEVKSKITYKKKIAEEAYRELVLNNVEVPEIVDYISKRLEDRDEYNLANLFDKAIVDSKSYSKDFHIFLIFEKNKWKEDILENLDNIQVELPNLTLNVVLINSLKDLIKETYSLVPEVAEEIVYNEQE
jgi:hypothetical protein